MRIGIDARALVGNKSGIGHYLEQILLVWAKKYPQHEYYLLAHADFELHESLSAMKKIIQRMKPSILWMHTVAPLLIAKHRIELFWGPNYAMPIMMGRGVKSVITIHDMVSFVYPETLPDRTVLHNQIGLPRYVRRVDRVITESESTRSDITRFLGLPKDEIVVSYLGVNERFFGRETDLADKLARYELSFPYILCVGTIEPRKNLISVVQAFIELGKTSECGQVHLVMVGAKGWKSSTLYELLEQHPEMMERVHFLGYVPDEDLPAIYQGAEIFVYPSLYEGFGLPLLEAMASGVPVITSNVSSMPEVVGDTGLLVNPSEPKELVEAIRSLCTDREMARQLADRAFERAKQFTWEQTASDTMRICEQVINGG